MIVNGFLGVFSAFYCHGSWEEHGTSYTVVSRKASDGSIKHSNTNKTFCFTMRLANAADKPTGRNSRVEHREQELLLLGPTRTCESIVDDRWDYRLANQGKTFKFL